MFLSPHSKRTGSPAEDYDTPDVNKPKGYFGLVRPKLTLSLAPLISLLVPIRKVIGRRKGSDFSQSNKGWKPLSNAEITLMAVDRGVIDLINYHVPNPINFFIIVQTLLIT